MCKMLDLYLIRHAESEMNNHEHLIGGRSNNSPLSQNGKHQAILLSQRFSNSKIIFDKLYSSTAKRAIDTVQPVCDSTGYSIDDVIKTSELLEIDQGDWEGKPRTEIYTPEVIARINVDNWNFTPPNGESQRMVEERMLRYVNENILSRHLENLVVGVFTHGMAIKCLLRGILESSSSMTYKIVLNNTSITRLKYSRRGWHIVTVNDTAHLLGESMIEEFYSRTPKSI